MRMTALTSIFVFASIFTACSTSSPKGEHLSAREKVKRTLASFTGRSPSSRNGGLEMSGFSIKAETDDAIFFNFQDEKTIIVSKSKFSSEREAIDFCTDYHDRLDTNFDALLFAMSGAANANRFIRNSISYKAEGKSGIASWAGRGNNSVMIMLDGEGDNGQESTLADLRAAHIHLELPAICDKSKD